MGLYQQHCPQNIAYYATGNEFEHNTHRHKEQIYVPVISLDAIGPFSDDVRCSRIEPDLLGQPVPNAKANTPMNIHGIVWFLKRSCQTWSISNNLSTGQKRAYLPTYLNIRNKTIPVKAFLFKREK